VVETSVELGQLVKAGDILVRLDNLNEKLHLAEEESRIKAFPDQITALQKQITAMHEVKNQHQLAAQAAVQSAESRQKETDAAIHFAQEYERRLTELSENGDGVLVETLRAKAETQKLRSARAALSSDLLRIQIEAQTQAQQHQAEIENLKQEAAKLKGEFETSQITISRLNHEIEQHLIRAPATGRIGDLSALQIGRFVSVGEKLGSVIPDSEIKIVADFPPASVLGRIKPGQRAQMRLDGFPWAQFGGIAATVSRVGSEIRDNLVRVEFTPQLRDGSTIILQHGLPGWIEVNIEQISPALLVLRKAGQLFARENPAPKMLNDAKT
jgi:membrane fusion protein (multidrug efflux system)